MTPHTAAGFVEILAGQHGIRTGLTKVGSPGALMGLSQRDPFIGGLLKNLGYATGQFGKNHGVPLYQRDWLQDLSSHR
jgi:arylsulfatase A-like enzyme